MKMLLIYFPFIISFLSGYFLLSIILKKEKPLEPLFNLSLSCGLGLGLSSYLTYLGFLIFNQYSAPFLIFANILVLVLLGAASFYLIKDKSFFLTPFKESGLRDLSTICVFVIFFIPLWIMANFYPFGGWDAWAVWGVKAKFLFLAEDNWERMFEPILWRSSPRYPLLLPFVNVWGWAFQETPLYQVPLFTSLVFTFLNLSLLVSGLGTFIKSKFVIVTAVCLLTSSSFALVSISQYADGALGYYLFAGLLCLVLAAKHQKQSYCFLGGIFIGFLSFTKPEGLIVALIVCGLSFPFILRRNKGPFSRQLILSFIIGSAVTLIPSILFYLFVAPQNVTSINGFTSSTDPATLARLKIILSFYLAEITSPKWNSLWIVLLLGLLFAGKKAFHPKIIIIPTLLFLYGCIITVYYTMNTYFEIMWWLSVTLNRILASLVPIILFWIYYSLWQDSPEKIS